MSNHEKCVEYVKEYTDSSKKLENFWTETYDKIESVVVASRLFDIAVVLESNEHANTFCQRAMSDLLERRLVVDGHLQPGLVNEITDRGLAKQLALSTVHYATNYVQNQVRPRRYGKYLRRFFR